MTQQTENAQWHKGKQEITIDYDEKRKALLSNVAGRNFSKAPGFLYEAFIGNEEQSKLKLSALNYRIVADAIERELKQTGHDYDIAYKDARIAFELEKQTLLTALQQEFSDLDYVQGLKEEELNRLFVELDVRRIVLITTKTSLDIEMEELNQELQETDRLTFSNEERLIQERLNTVNAKLTVIPYIENIIDAKGRLLTAEEANYDDMEDLITEKGLLVDKKEEIIPYIEDKSVKQLLLAAALLEQIDVEEARLDVAISKAGLRTEAVDNTISIIEAEKAVETLRGLLYVARNELQITRIDVRKALVDNSTTNITGMSGIIAKRNLMMTVLEGYKADIASGHRAARTHEVDEEINGNETVNATYLDAEAGAGSNLGSIRNTAWFQANAKTRTATIHSIAKITNRLVHLLGS